MAENNVKEYLDSLGLIRLVANIINKFATKEEMKAKTDSLQSSIDSVDSSIDNIKSGNIVVKEAEHADAADTATNAVNATNATNANHANTANTATNATNATNAVNAEKANHATSADTATNANHAATADSANTATTATNASHATSADTATNATTADKVSKSITVQLNGGTTEGTNKFTYDGSTAKSFNITPGNIDAYTKGEVDSALSKKASDTHNHDEEYDAKGTASNVVTAHNTNADAHNDIRLLISELSSKVTGFLNIDDDDFDTLSELVSYIEANRESIESFTTSKVNVSDIVNNLTTNVSNKPLSAAQGVAIKSLIDALDSELDSHKHDASDVNFSDKNTTYATGVTVQSAIESLDSSLASIDNDAIDNNTIDSICGSTIVAASEVDL